MLQSLDGPELAGPHPRVIERGCQLLVDDLVDEAGLAGAGHAGHTGERPERDLHVDILEVVFRRAIDAQEIPVARPALRRDGNFLFPGQILPGDRARLRNEVVYTSRRDDLAAVDARAGSHVDDVVRRAHRVLIVLYHEHGVAEVAKMAQRIEQLVVVALVQSDGRLVENVEHAHQARADLRRQTDSLALAAGERCRRARERQIPESDGLQKFEPRPDLAQNLFRNNGHVACQSQVIHEFQLFRDRHRAEIHNAHPTDRHGEAHVRQPLAVTLRAGPLRHAALQLFAHRVRLRLLKPPLHIVHNALKRPLQRPAPVRAFIVDRQVLTLRAVQDHVERFLRQLPDGHGQREMVLLRQRLEIHPRDGIIPQIVPARGLDGSVEDGLVPVRNDEIGVGHELRAKARADRARAVGIVEREHPGRQLRQADPAVLTGVVLRKHRVAVFRDLI